jgi:hypothetical protein
MTRICSRVKRRLGVSTKFNRRKYLNPGQAKKGDRTFLTENQATDFAQKAGMKDFTVVKAKNQKKFKIVQRI